MIPERSITTSKKRATLARIGKISPVIIIRVSIRSAPPVVSRASTTGNMVNKLRIKLFESSKKGLNEVIAT